MLLLGDDDELPELPDELEMALVEPLGSAGLATIDATLLACTDKVQHKGCAHHRAGTGCRRLSAG